MMNLYRIHAWCNDFPVDNPCINVFVAASPREAERIAMGCEVNYRNGKGGSWSKLPHDCKILETRTLPDKIVPEISDLPVEDWGSNETDDAWERAAPVGVKSRLKTGRTSLYVNEEMAAKLGPLVERFGGLSKAVTVVSARYQEIMSIDRRTVKDLFTEGEINLMLNNALPTVYEPAGVVNGAVLADTQDEDRVVFQEFGVDRGVVLEKLKSLTTGQAFALVDWLEEKRGPDGEVPEA